MNHTIETNALNSEHTTVGEHLSPDTQPDPPSPSSDAGAAVATPYTASPMLASATVADPNVTLDDFLPTCVAVWRTYLNPSSMDTYLQIVRDHIMPFLGGTRIRDWDSRLIQAFTAYLDQKIALTSAGKPNRDGRTLGHTSKRCILRVLRAICDLAMERGVIKENLVSRLNQSARR